MHATRHSPQEAAARATEVGKGVPNQSSSHQSSTMAWTSHALVMRRVTLVIARLVPRSLLSHAADQLLMHDSWLGRWRATPAGTRPRGGGGADGDSNPFVPAFSPLVLEALRGRSCLINMAIIETDSGLATSSIWNLLPGMFCPAAFYHGVGGPRNRMMLLMMMWLIVMK